MINPILCILTIGSCFLTGVHSQETPPPAPDSREQLRVLMERYEEYRRNQSPEYARSKGDSRNAGRLRTTGIQAEQQRLQANTDFLQRLESIPNQELSESDRLDWELLHEQLSRHERSSQFGEWMLAIGGRFGPHVSIPQLAERVPFDSVEDYENYLSRLEDVPAHIDGTIEVLQAGLDQGMTPPRITMQSLPLQLEAALSGGYKHSLEALRIPIRSIPDTIEPEEADRLRTRFNQVSLPRVLAHLMRFRSFLVETYIPGCRETIGASEGPGGRDYYDFTLASFTTTDMTADQIHQLGMSEVMRIRGLMHEVIMRSDFSRQRDLEGMDRDAIFREFIEYLRTDPRFYCESEEQLLTGYRDICKRVDAQLPRYFRTLPTLPYGVRAIPRFMAPTQTTAYYMPGSMENSEPGWFYANTYALDMRPSYEMIPLAHIKCGGKDCVVSS